MRWSKKTKTYNFNGTSDEIGIVLDGNFRARSKKRGSDHLHWLLCPLNVRVRSSTTPISNRSSELPSHSSKRSHPRLVSRTQGRDCHRFHVSSSHKTHTEDVDRVKRSHEIRWEDSRRTTSPRNIGFHWHRALTRSSDLVARQPPSQ